MSFGGSGVIAENVRDEQRKVIKYNHLVANLLIFHTLVTMTRGLQQMREDGYDIDMEALATFSPYQTEHINRFGLYTLNPNRIPGPLGAIPSLTTSQQGSENPTYAAIREFLTRILAVAQKGGRRAAGGESLRRRGASVLG